MTDPLHYDGSSPAPRLRALIGRSSSSQPCRLIHFLLMLCLTLWLFCPPPLTAAEPSQSTRPRIGLVLSGGGARGAAHIGVLKVLEELRIPIDVITGTSMGAIVGGIYAAGRSPAELEGLVTSMAWNQAFLDRPPSEELSFRRKEDNAGQMIKFDAGIHEGKLALPLGLIQGQNLNFILKSHLLHTAMIDHFDHLPIPFRALATDIETGEPVVLAKGELAQAMRASMSIPGVLAPVEINGRLLVDGGISNNLPIDVARQLGADHIIAVNIGTLRRSRVHLTSAMMITTQVMTIMIQKNTDAQIATLGKCDVLIQPFLGSIGSSDFDKAREAIQIGEAEAHRLASQFAELALSPEAYAAWRSAKRHTPSAAPVIDAIAVKNPAPLSPEVVRAQLHTRTGEPLNLETLEQDLKRIYSISTYERADFHLQQRGGKTNLIIDTKASGWGPSYLRLGLSMDNDFEGSANYNLSANLLTTGINPLGAEWENNVQLGDTPRFFSEFYQPLDQTLQYFIAPRVEYKSWNINAYQEGTTVSQYRATVLEAGLDLGRQFGNWGQVRIGVRRGTGKVGVRIGHPEPEIKFDSGALFTSLAYNRLDNFNFPRHGTVANLIWLIPREELGSDYSGHGLLFSWLTANSLSRHTLLTSLTIQSALHSEVPLQNSYSLGGFLNLSGFAPDELSGHHTALARLVYYYELGSTGLGEFRMPLFLGGSLEGGNAWQTRSDINGRSLLLAGSLLIGADTYLGPVYLAYGQAEGGHRSVYLYVGHKF